MSALNSSAALRKRVESAIAEAVFTRASLLTVQTDASMLRLSSMLLGNPQLRAAYYDHFAAAVSQRRESYELLKQLLQSAPVTAALATPEVQQLVACQIANLQRLSAVPPYMWNMPQAVVPGGVQNSQQVSGASIRVAEIPCLLCSMQQSTSVALSARVISTCTLRGYIHAHQC